jgi:hypothetical protein
VGEGERELSEAVDGGDNIPEGKALASTLSKTLLVEMRTECFSLYDERVSVSVVRVVSCRTMTGADDFPKEIRPLPKELVIGVLDLLKKYNCEKSTHN